VDEIKSLGRYQISAFVELARRKIASLRGKKN
jgi:hypothetical protein